MPENSEIRAIACAIPLLGPSFGIDPDGQSTPPSVRPIFNIENTGGISTYGRGYFVPS